MPLEDVQAIDRIETPGPGKLRLVVVDTGQTEDAAQRLAALLAKLRTYVSYCLSEDFAAKHPGVELADVTIVVESPLPPTEDMAQIHEVGPEGDRTRVVRVEYVSPGPDGVADASPEVNPAVSPWDRLTLPRIRQLKIVALICALAGVAVFIGWGSNAWSARRLANEGVDVQGTVLGASVLDKAYGRNKYKLPVQYTVAGDQQPEQSIKKIFLVLEEVYEQARVAGTIEVRYLPDDPQMSSVESHNPTPMNYLATALELWAVALIGWFVLWRLEKRKLAAGARAGD